MQSNPEGHGYLGFWPSWAHHIGDLVFGANLSPLVAIVLGLANLLADGIAMGAGNYLGMRSEQDYQRSLGGPVREGSLHAAGHGAAIFGAFIAAGSVPLLPFPSCHPQTLFSPPALRPASPCLWWGACARW